MSETEIRYKKMFWLSIFLSMVIGPIWFFASPAPVNAMNNPVQMFFIVWLMSLLFSFILFFGWYSGEVMEKPHKKGIYYKLVIGLMAFMIFSALVVKLTFA